MVIERLLDLVTLLGLFFLGLKGVADGRIPDAVVSVAAWMAAAGATAVFVILMFSGRVERLVQWVSDCSVLTARGWSKLIRRQGLTFFGMLGVLRTPALALQLVALSLLAWTLEGAVFATVGHALGIATAMGPWFALATGTLGTLLPSSPGYVGTFDYLALLGLVAYGADRDLAAAFAFIVHVVLWLPLTLIGMIYFLRPGARLLRRHAVATVSAQEEPR
jgi:uncharacterized membrane protein YbhN (UPF0104 family)